MSTDAGRKIVIEFLGKDTSASSTARGVGKSTGKLGGSFKKLSLLAGGAAVTGAAALFKVGESFADMRNNIIVGTGASGDALDALTASAKKVGKSTPSSFGDVGVAIADLNTRLGLTGKPLQQMSRQFLNLSRITKTDLAGNIANASRVFGDWGVTAKDQPAALDAIFEATKRTGIGLDRLTNNVVQFGAPLRQFGFDFEESLALFGKWEKEGVNTEVVLAGMKAGLGKFSKAGKEPAKALDDITVALKKAGSAGEANQIAIEAFGQRAGPDMAAAVREGRFELGDMADQLRKSGGAIKDADKRTRTFRESLTLLKNRVLIPLEPIAVKVFDAVGKGLLWIADQFKGNSKEAGKFAEVFKKVKDTLSRVWAAIGGDVSATVASIRSIIDSFVKYGSFLWGKFGTTIVDYLKNAFQNVKQVVRGALRIVSGIFQVFASVLKGDWKGVWTGIKKILSGAWIAIKALVKQGWNVIKSLFKVAGIAIRTVFKGIWSGIKGVARAGMNALVSQVKAIPGRLKALGGAFKSAGTAIIRAFVNGLKGAGGFIKGIAGSIWGAVKTLINGAINKINAALDFTISIPGPDIRINAPDIPRLASGGIVRASRGGTLAVIGEGGHDEAVVPLSGPNAPSFARGGGDDRPILVKVYLDSKEIHQALVKRKRVTGLALGLA